jgi:hypothetical protein
LSEDQELNREQNRRLREVEARVNEVENMISGLTARIDTLIQIGKVILLVVGASVGIDVSQMGEF